MIWLCIICYIILALSLIVSTISNVALVSRLRAAKRREEAWKNARKW